MIGIYGGTFDPVHFGHLRPVLDVSLALNLSEVRFIPCGQPAHRDAPRASATQRAHMLELALADNPRFILDRRELEREGPSYMVDTLASLAAEYDEDLCLILGWDAFIFLDSWHRWTELIDFAHLVVTQRPGWEHDLSVLPESLQAVCREREVSPPELLNYPVKDGARLTFIEVTQLAISATEIRDLRASNKDIRYLVPDAVYKLIYKEDIYR